MDIDCSISNNEHIFPLALGGVNGFCLPVSREFNSRVGSSIDGALANDFLVSFRRRQFDARGHSGRAPSVVSKRSTMGEGRRPVQVEFKGGAGLSVFDSIDRRILSHEETVDKSFTSSFYLKRFSRARFAAKVALSAGYLFFGNWFRHNVNHAEVRSLMNYEHGSVGVDYSGFKLRIVDELFPPERKDEDQASVERFFCQMIDGSCVYFMVGPENIAVTVGVLGKFVATLNIEADTDNFPFDIPVPDHNDLGHAAVIENGVATRMSYRALAYRAHEVLKR